MITLIIEAIVKTKGVEYQMATSNGDQIEHLMQQAGVLETYQRVGEMNRQMLSCVTLLRESERAQVLGVNIGDHAANQANQALDLARRAAQQARDLMAAQRGTPEHRLFLEGMANVRDQLDGSLSTGQSLFRAVLQRSNLPPGDAQHIYALWDEPAQAARSGGVDDVFNFVDQRLASFLESVTAENNFGRNPASPLEEWEWILIAAIMGVIIIALVACLVFSGCTWIATLFVSLFCLAGSQTGIIAVLCVAAAGITF